MRDIVSKRNYKNEIITSNKEKDEECELLYRIKVSTFKQHKKDITLELLEYLILKRINMSQRSPQNQNQGEEKKSGGFGSFLGMILTILFIIVLLITIVKTFGFGNDGKGDPFEIFSDLSRFKNMKCFGNQKKIDVVSFMIFRNSYIMKKAKQEILEELIRPPDKNYLLYGEPGTGKTMFIKKLSYFYDFILKIEKRGNELRSVQAFNEKKITTKELNSLPSELVLITAQPSDLIDKYVGETEKKVKKVFEEASKHAKKGKTVFIFIDEVDTFFSDRKKETSEHGLNMKSQFLSMLEGTSTSIKSKIFFFGATNFEKNIDGAFLRRMGTHLEFKAPDEEERREIIKKNIASDLFQDEEKLNECVRVSEGMTQSNFASAFYELNRSKFETSEAFKYEDIIEIFSKYRQWFGRGKKLAPINIKKFNDSQLKKLPYYKYKIVGNFLN